MITFLLSTPDFNSVVSHPVLPRVGEGLNYRGMLLKVKAVNHRIEEKPYYSASITVEAE